MKIYADELRPGDVVAHDGHTRRITHVDRRDGWAWPIAVDGSGWAIALDHRLIDVHPHRGVSARRRRAGCSTVRLRRPCPSGGWASVDDASERRDCTVC